MPRLLSVMPVLPALSMGHRFAVLALLPVLAWAQALSAHTATASTEPAAAASGAQHAARAPLELRVQAPAEAVTTVSGPHIHVMGRTAPDARVRVAGEPAQVFSTGVFVRDHVPLTPGDNRIVVQAQGPDGQTATQTLQVLRQPPAAAVEWPAQRLYLNGLSLQPSQTVYLRPGEAVEVAVQATPGQRVRARLAALAGQPWQPLYEARPGQYRASLAFAPAAAMADLAPAQVQVELLAVSASITTGRGQPRRISALTPGAVGQWPNDADRLWVAGEEGAALLHGLHDVRLGGPFLAEVPAGTVLHITGQQGDHLRAQLAPDAEAWVAAASGRWAPPGTAPPRAHFTSLSVTGSDQGDVVQIPLAAPVPYAVSVRADPASGGANRHSLELDLYGTHHATTWISHRASAKVVREVTAEQRAPGLVRLRVALQGPRLWGWRVERTAQTLRLIIRPAPVLAATGPALAGLRVALEPGHGGPTNLGAVGATGTPEKDINRWAALALKEELEAAGADVLLVRAEDSNPSLRERAERAVAANAHVYISLHGNAVDVGGGYLRVSGASTFYKHAHSRDLAAALQQQVLQQTGLADFGLVGNFNYTPIRLVTWMPAVLVEQAFVSHPGDEARLLDPAFRQQLARAVRQGLEAFVRAP